MSDKKRNRNKLLVIGIDGGTLDIVVPMTKAGKLPNMKFLIDKGIIGKTLSTVPSFTAPAWASFVTGTNPGVHGYYNFRSRVTLDETGQQYVRPFINTKRLQGKTLWSVLTAHNRKVSSINFPMTHPPEPVDGVMISGMLALDGSKEFTYPNNFMQELTSIIDDYKIDMDFSLYEKGQIGQFLDNLYYTTEKRKEAALYVMRKYAWDLFMVVFTGSDRVQHFFWKYMDESHPCYTSSPAYGGEIEKYYKKLDKIVGDLLLEGKDSNIIILSDHGFGPCKKLLYLNKWLNQQGFLTLRKDGSIDFTKTFAYSCENAEMAINLNVKGREPLGIISKGRKFESVRNTIIENLKTLRDPETDIPIVENIYKGEEFYHGPYAKEANDIVFTLLREEYLPSEAINADNRVVIPSEIISGTHRKEGMYIMRADGIDKSREGPTINLESFMPTILCMMGSPIPLNLKDRIPNGLFAESFFKKNPLQFDSNEILVKDIDTRTSNNHNGKNKILKEKLRSLGYLG